MNPVSTIPSVLFIGSSSRHEWMAKKLRRQSQALFELIFLKRVDDPPERIIREVVPDLVIVGGPSLATLEFLGFILRLTGAVLKGKTPLILSTADPEDRERTLEMGVNTYLSEGYPLEVLFVECCRLLRIHT